MAIGTTVLAAPLVHTLFGASYDDAATLLAIGIWRAPLLTLAFLYQTTLIALNRESAGVRMLLDRRRHARSPWWRCFASGSACRARRQDRS